VYAIAWGKKPIGSADDLRQDSPNNIAKKSKTTPHRQGVLLSRIEQRDNRTQHNLGRALVVLAEEVQYASR
jgi:hypothetical protein